MLLSGLLLGVSLAVAAAAAQASISALDLGAVADDVTCGLEPFGWDVTSVLQVNLEVEAGAARGTPQASAPAFSEADWEDAPHHAAEGVDTQNEPYQQDAQHDAVEGINSLKERSYAASLLSSSGASSSSSERGAAKAATQLEAATRDSLSNTMIILVLLSLAMLGIYIVARDAMSYTDNSSQERAAMKAMPPSNRPPSLVSVPARPSYAPPPTAGGRRPSVALSVGRPSLGPAAAAPATTPASASLPPVFMQPPTARSSTVGAVLPVVSSAPPATTGGAPLGSRQALTLPIASASRAAPSGSVGAPATLTTAPARQLPMAPPGGSILGAGARNSSSPAPSPRRMATMALQPPALAQVMDQKLTLVEPHIWASMEPFFVVSADQLPAEVGSTGDFQILTGAMSEVAFRGSVTTVPPMRKRVFSLSLPGARGPLASCIPCPGAGSVVGGVVVEPYTELQLRNKDEIVWGTLAAKGDDRYSVSRGTRQVLTLEGDQEEGRLIVVLEGEAVAHAAKSPFGEHLEIGVKPNVDPVLMLLSVLSVVIFNPEDAP